VINRILLLNNVSPAGLARFPSERYEIGHDIAHPDAILVRSFDMRSMKIADSVKAVGRAGIGVDNIPVDALSARGIPVFNTPGANANAVKELVIAGLLLAARNIFAARDFVRGLDADPRAFDLAVEAGKKQFIGFELAGRTLGVVGLGAVGVEVANAALGLGMRVIGFDPAISVSRAWQLSSGVQQAASLEALLADADMVTLHAPLTPETRGLLDHRRLRLMRDRTVLLNFARAHLIDETALAEALESKTLLAYVTDFPTAAVRNHPSVVALPHIGASTVEAEASSVSMAVDRLKEYLEDGVIRHSVNYPDAVLARGPGSRIAIANANVPGVVGHLSTAIADAGLNISDMLNVSRGDFAYTLVDVEGVAPPGMFERVTAIEGVLSARLL